MSAPGRNDDSADPVSATGVFADIVFDRPLEDIIKDLPLASNIVDALLRREGQLGSLLRCVLAHEQRNWHEAQSCAQLKLETLTGMYEEAVAWTLRSLSALSDRKNSSASVA